jgi:hypothetical protein
MNKLIRVAIATVVAVTPLTLAGASKAGPGVIDPSKTYIEMRQSGKRVLGIFHSDFQHLRIGMTVTQIRAIMGNPTTSSTTPNGDTCHTFQHVLDNELSWRDSSNYRAVYELLTVGNGEEASLKGWRGEHESILYPCSQLEGHDPFEETVGAKNETK